jgi:uncharacterized protein (DUF2062 family)
MRRVARGLAVGTFGVFVIPFAKMVAAAAHCTWWRANVPAAAAMAMVTKPLTSGFWFWPAYQQSALVLGEPMGPPTPTACGASSWLAEFGWPTVQGMGMFANGGATLGYVGGQTDLAPEKLAKTVYPSGGSVNTRHRPNNPFFSKY